MEEEKVEECAPYCPRLEDMGDDIVVVDGSEVDPGHL